MIKKLMYPLFSILFMFCFYDFMICTGKLFGMTFEDILSVSKTPVFILGVVFGSFAYHILYQLCDILLIFIFGVRDLFKNRNKEE